MKHNFKKILFSMAALILAANCWNCDGSSGGTTQTFYIDADGDGYGDPSISVQQATDGYVADNTDCDDDNKRVHPGSIVAENLDPMLAFDCGDIYSYLAQNTIYADSNILDQSSWDASARVLVVLTRDSSTLLLTSSRQANYDSFGNILIDRNYNTGDTSTPVSSSTQNTVDSSGNIIITRYHANGDIDDNDITSSIEYTYDSNGNLLTQINHDPGDVDINTNIVSSEENTYDANDNLITTLEYDNGGLDSPVTISIEITYNDQNEAVITRRHENGGLSTDVTSSTEVTYDSEGNAIITRVHGNGDLDTPVTQARTSTYDSQGNRLTTVIYNAGDIDSTPGTSQEITYSNQSNPLVILTRLGGLTSPVSSSEQFTYDETGSVLTDEVHDGGDLDSPITSFTLSNDYIPILQPLFFRKVI